MCNFCKGKNHSVYSCGLLRASFESNKLAIESILSGKGLCSSCLRPIHNSGGHDCTDTYLARDANTRQLYKFQTFCMQKCRRKDNPQKYRHFSICDHSHGQAPGVAQKISQSWSRLELCPTERRGAPSSSTINPNIEVEAEQGYHSTRVFSHVPRRDINDDDPYASYRVEYFYPPYIETCQSYISGDFDKQDCDCDGCRLLYYKKYEPCCSPTETLQSHNSEIIASEVSDVTTFPVRFPPPLAQLDCWITLLISLVVKILTNRHKYRMGVQS